jgi:hypothetical protein
MHHALCSVSFLRWRCVRHTPYQIKLRPWHGTSFPGSVPFGEGFLLPCQNIDEGNLHPRPLNDRSQHSFGYESTIVGELSSLLRTDKIDFVVLNRAGPTLFTRIINSGTLLFERDRPRRIDIENTARMEYINVQPLRDIQDFYLARKLKAQDAGS